MANGERGFTAIEMGVGIFVIAWMGLCIGLLYLVARALLKYIGS